MGVSLIDYRRELSEAWADVKASIETGDASNEEPLADSIRETISDYQLAGKLWEMNIEYNAPAEYRNQVSQWWRIAEANSAVTDALLARDANAAKIAQERVKKLTDSAYAEQQQRTEDLERQLHQKGSY